MYLQQVDVLGLVAVPWLASTVCWAGHVYAAPPFVVDPPEDCPTSLHVGQNARLLHAALSDSTRNPSLWPMLALLQSLIEDAPSNMAFMSVTAAVLKPPIGWSKEVASKNMPSMLVTAAVLKPPIGWLNAYAV